MKSTNPIHHLTKINKKRRTAVCSVCGKVDVYIFKSPNQPQVIITCKNRLRQSYKDQTRRRRDKRESENPKLKNRHRLSQIDVENMKAVCSVCGQTEIRKRITDKKYTVYICNTKKRDYRRRYTLSQYKAPPLKS